MTTTMTNPGINPFTSDTRIGTGPVLVALKPSGGGDSALATAQWLADKTHAELHVVSIIEAEDAAAVAAGAPPLPPEFYLRECTDTRSRLKADAAQGPHGDSGARVDVLGGATSITIAETARERGASVIVVGTGRHTVPGRYLYGERALDVVRTAAGPVLVVPPAAQPPFAHALVAVDFSEASMRAAVSALGMLEPGGHLTIVHVKNTVRLSEQSVGWWNDAYEVRSRELLTRFAGAVPATDGIVVDTQLLHGDILDALVLFVSEQGVDLVCCGRGRHSLVERILTASVSTAIVRRAPCAVLVAPEVSSDMSRADASWMSGMRVSHSPAEWPELLRAFSHRNAGRIARLAIEGTGADPVRSLENGYAFLAAEYGSMDKRANIMLGNLAALGTHVTHKIGGLRELQLSADTEGRDSSLQLDTGTARYLVTFQDAH